ncbi:tail protein X [Brucella sp. TWI432]
MLNRVFTNIKGEKVYITVDGDKLDDIAYVYYGKHSKNTEALLEANPDSLAFGPVLPAGVRIILPAIPQEEQAKAFKTLWD